MYVGKTQSDMLRCSKCKNIYYCNGECQRGDWNIHKNKCVITSNNNIVINKSEKKGDNKIETSTATASKAESSRSPSPVKMSFTSFIKESEVVVNKEVVCRKRKRDIGEAVSELRRCLGLSLYHSQAHTLTHSLSLSLSLSL